MLKYIKKYFINYFIKFILIILIASLNDMFFLGTIIINITGLCSFFRLSVEMLTFYLFMIFVECLVAGFLLWLDITSSKNFIVDEKKYFVWTCTGLFEIFNIYLLFTIYKTRIFL